MTRRDEFDDPEGFQSAFGKIAEAMEQGHGTLRRRGRLLGVLTALVALFILFAVFWSSYPRDRVSGNGPIPTIRADTAPYKTTPDNPGGMDIPYRDSTVFEALKNGKGEGKVESLLPPAEQPIPREKMFAGLKIDPIEENVDVSTTPEKAAEKDKDVAVKKTADNEADTEDDPDSDLDAGPVTASTGAEQAGAILPATKKPAPVAATPVSVVRDKGTIGESGGGNAYVQLGSVKDRPSADNEWKRLQKQFPAQLGDLTLRVQEVALGPKGTFYRIQAGAVTAEDARAICKALSAQRKGGCIVVAH